MRSIPSSTFARTRLLRRPLSLALAATLASQPSQAQCTVPALTQGNFVCSPALTSGAYTAITSGDLNDNLSPEVALIRGGSLIVHQDPDSESVAVKVADDARDVCYAPSAGGPNDPGLLYLSPSGLRRVLYDDQAWEYYDEPVDGAPLWQAATRIRWATEWVAPLIEASLIGYAPSPGTFFRSTVVGGGLTAAMVLFDFTSPVLDYVLLDWDGAPDGQLEIGILHAGGVQIRDQSGAVLLNRPSAMQGDAITAVRRQGWTDSLAWVMRTPNGMAHLLLCNAAFPGNHFQGPWQLGPHDFHSIAAADLRTPDGAEDLVLASSSPTLQLHFLDADANAEQPWFSGVPNDTVDMSVGPLGTTTPTGPILVANLFNDWSAHNQAIPGFAVALAGKDGLRLVPDPGSPQSTISEDYQGVEFWTARAADGVCGDDPDHARWEITLGDGWGETSATWIEMIVRKCPDEDVEPGAWKYVVQPLEGEGIAGQVLEFDGIETLEFELEDYGTKYFTKIRPRNATQAWRWSVLGMSGNCDGFWWLTELPGASSDLVEMTQRHMCDEDQEPNCHSGSRYIPTAVPQTFIPSSPGAVPLPLPH